MKWIKEREPYRAKLVHEVNLAVGGKIVASAKNTPIVGTVTHYGYKKIGNNNVKMCIFYPDVAPDSYWSFSSKWFERINDSKGMRK